MDRLREANGQLVAATICAERFADEVEAARRLAADSEERFRTLVVAASAMVWRANAAGEIELERPGGGSWLDAVHPDEREAVGRHWRNAVAASTVYVCEHRMAKRDGYAWVEARAVPIMRGGVAREWIGMMTDISERVEMERAREQFMAILSHDLRAPLAAVSISADALRLLELDAPFERLGRRDLQYRPKRMAELVQDVMDFARGRLGKGIPLWASKCDLNVVCVDMIAEARRVHPHREITLVSDGIVVGEWDAERLAQVISNFCSGNAITHGADPIVVAVCQRSGDAVVSVESHGARIPDPGRATLFEPFSRSYNDRGGGLGLGLYIVSEIVKAHRGSIVVRSDETTNTFEVTLPGLDTLPGS